LKIRTALVSILAIALFWWFLRHARLADVWQQVRRAQLELVALSFVFAGLSYWARVVRWQYLLAPVGPTRFRTAFRATMIGFAASFVLPARVGEVLRPYLLARQEGLSATATFATVVVERVLDLIAVLALLALFLWSAEPTAMAPGLLRSVRLAAGTTALISLALMAGMILIASRPQQIAQLVLRAGRALPQRVVRALAQMAQMFSEGLAVAREPRPLLIAVVWSFPLWVMIAAEAWCVTRAFGIDMSFTGGFLLQALLVIGVAVPTPGAVGGFHEAYRLGVTTFFGAQESSAVGAAIVLHAISFVPVTLIGILFMVQDGLDVRRLSGLAEMAPQGAPEGSR
jgi:uncharacterized protein (TIRG00374 family)